MDNLPTTAPAYETSLTDRQDIQQQLSISFANLRAALRAASNASLDGEVTAMGESSTLRSFWVAHVNHLHEHLGQLIAYSRMNGVAPPWA